MSVSSVSSTTAIHQHSGTRPSGPPPGPPPEKAASSTSKGLLDIKA